MPWISSNTGLQLDWTLDVSVIPNRLHVRPDFTQNKIYKLSYKDVSFNWKSNKTYQYVISTTNVYATAASFSVGNNWGDSFGYYNGATSSGNPGSVTQSWLFYSKCNNSSINNYYLDIYANGTFSSNGAANMGILGLDVRELDFQILGYSYYKLAGTELTHNNSNSIGWYYDKSTDIYFWYDRCGTSFATQSGLYPVGGPNGIKKQDVGYRLNNAIFKYIQYQSFNLTFHYENTSDYPVYVYLYNSIPSYYPASINELLTGTLSSPINDHLICTLTQSSGTNVGFYGLKGNQYLIIRGGYVGTASATPAYTTVYIKNLTVEGGYHTGNNRQYIISEDYIPIGLTGATFTYFVGSGNTVNSVQSLSISEVFSKFGNGYFKSGIWENGVWNSGWRKDEKMKEFYDVNNYVVYNKDKRWRLQIYGPSSSISYFNVGDNVSIGNITAIDINENRKLLKKYFTIIQLTNNSIVVEFDNDFPLRRIEKDSTNHRIYVTKNIWLSGGFLNGYFTGVWNYGLFKGYPLITEMFDTQWIDGNFSGGHFKSSIYNFPNFTGTFINSNGTLYNNKLGLSFSTNHNLIKGDIITITKDDNTFNTLYNGDTKVIDIINDYKVVVDIDYIQDVINESGSIYSEISSGLLQNVNFDSLNISKTTSDITSDTSAVFLYNSWMELNYCNYSAVNIGKSITLKNPISNKFYPQNNLYGYPTKDILESVSTFRDSYSTTNRKYKLGNKYKKFYDYIGDSGNFQTYFGTQSKSDVESFLNLGWTYSSGLYSPSSVTPSDIQFLRTEPDESLKGSEMKVNASLYGGVLDINQNNIDSNITNRNYQDIEKNRYTVVEFDLVTYSTNIANQDLFYHFVPYYFTYNDPDPNTIYELFIPHIHFNNINTIKTKYYNGTSTYSIINAATYLPIYSNINHLTTSKSKKIEYFYNKTNLDMFFHGYSTYTNNYVDYIIDNLHFYEVDMIPFFQYFLDSNINKGIQIPYSGISPYIDYSNSNFDFLNNITIGLDSIQISNSNTPISESSISQSQDNSIYISSDGLIQTISPF